MVTSARHQIVRITRNSVEGQRHHLSVQAEPVPRGGGLVSSNYNCQEQFRILLYSWVPEKHLMAISGGNGKVYVTCWPLGWYVRIYNKYIRNSLLHQTSSCRYKPVCLHVCFPGRGVGFGHYPNEPQLLASGSP